MRRGRSFLVQHVLAGAVSVALAAAAYWLFVIDRRPPLEFLAGEITPATVDINGEFQPVWQVRVWRRCDGTTYRRIVDGRRVAHVFEAQPTLAASLSASRFPGDVVRVAGRRGLRLPIAAAPGPARFVAVIEFDGCRWWHALWPIVVHLPELGFEITR